MCIHIYTTKAGRGLGAGTGSSATYAIVSLINLSQNSLKFKLNPSEEMVPAQKFWIGRG